ncbi:nucleotide exchange factor GrpE [Lichenicola sp.]|uniref:nucleotide exchange factor GrpE n=1 Tax=Lichenicola sp. TaxID=2804529 RepID=UPI003AFFFE4C
MDMTLGRPDDQVLRPSPVMAMPVGQPRVPEFVEQWPMQKIAADMIDFAEELHRGQAVPRASEAEGRDGRPSALMQLEARLTTLLARNGIERDDPTGSQFDPRIHQKVAERCVPAEAPGTVVRTISSSWTLNGQLLRPAMVVVSAPPADAHAPPMEASLSFCSPGD